MSTDGEPQENRKSTARESLERFTNAEFWLTERDIPVHTSYLTLMAVHGSLCLALRHPQNKGASRPLVVKFVKSLGEWLVHEGALTPEQLAEAQKLEAEEGSADLQ